MRLRRFLGWMLALGLAGCGGGGGSSLPSATPAQQSATVALSLDISRLTSSTQRKPEFIGAGITQFNFVEFSGTQVVFAGGGSFTSCPAGGPCNATVTAAAGTNLTFTVNVTNSTKTLGTATTPAPVTIAAGSTTTLSLQVAPVFATGSLALSAPTTFYANGVAGQTANLVFKALDPLGNIINLAGGPVPNWPTVSLTANDPSFVLPPSITSPPATTAGTTVTINYGGGAVQLSASSPSLVVGTQGGGPSNTVSIPVVFMSSTPANPSATAAGINIAFTEANSNTAAFGEADTCAGDAAIGAPSYGTSGPGGINETATYTVTALIAFASCTMTVNATDFAGVQQ